MDMWMDVDTALAEVPVNLLPLLDDTDFKTIEDAVAYNAAGMDLRWNFVTPGGAQTSTAVTPTTAGTYDWTHQGDGIYTIEIPASGGASINNDTEGFGWFSGKATGVLPWRGPVIGFRAAGLNDALIEGAYSATRGLAGTALPNAAADAAGGLPISDAGGLDLDARIGTDIPAILVDTAVIGAAGAGLTAVPWNASWDAEVQSEVNDGLADAGVTTTRTGYLDNLSAGAVAQASALATLAGKFTGITLLSEWLGLIAGKQTGNATARTELRATGAGSGTYDETADSQEALRDRGDAAWTTATGFSTHSAADAATAVWAAGTRTLSAFDASFKTGYALSSAGVQAIWDALTSALTTVGSIGKLLVDNINATISSRLASASYTTPPTVGAIADQVWDETLADHLTAGSTGAGLNAAGSAGDPWSTALPGAYTSGQAGKILGDNLNATVSSRASQTSVDTVDDLLDTEVAAIKTVVDAIEVDTQDIQAKVGTPAGASVSADVAAVKVDTAAILADTGTDGVVVATASKTGYALSTAGVDAILDDTIGDSTITVRQALKLAVATLGGKLSGAATSTVTIRNAADDTNVVVATVDADGNRSAVTLTL